MSSVNPHKIPAVVPFTEETWNSKRWHAFPRVTQLVEKQRTKVKPYGSFTHRMGHGQSAGSGVIKISVNVVFLQMLRSWMAPPVLPETALRPTAGDCKL